MSKSKTKKENVPSPKKEIRNQIADQLKNALTGLEEKIGKEEFESRIKKAAKLLSAGIKTKPAKPAKTKPAKKDNPVTGEKSE
jgi:hypothetical protein